MERGKQNLPTAHTRLCIASIYQRSRGALLAQACRREKGELDDDVRKYLNGDYPNL